MTKATAALRGAMATALWAATLCAVSAASVKVFQLARSNHGYVGGFVRFFGGGLEASLFIIPAAAVAGALAALLGRFAELPPPGMRWLVLWVAFFPAVGAGTAVVLWIVGLLGMAGLVGPSMPERATLVDAITVLPKALFGVLFLGLPWFTPGLALPLMGAAWSVEGATRPPDQPATGLARPRNRALVGIALIGIVAACLLYVAVPGAP